MCISPKPCVHLLTYTPFSVRLDPLRYMFWTQILDECTLFAYVHMCISLDIVHMYIRLHVYTHMYTSPVGSCMFHYVQQNVYTCTPYFSICFYKLIKFVYEQDNSKIILFSG